MESVYKKLSFKLRVVIILLSLSIWGFSFYISDLKIKTKQADVPARKECSKNFFLPFNKITEVDVKFLITQDSAIVFSSNEKGNYCLYRYKNGTTELSSDPSKDTFSPFLSGNEIIGLQDSVGHENFQPSQNFFLRYTKRRAVVNVTSSFSGRYIVLQYKDEHVLHLINTTTKTTEILAGFVNKLHGVAFSADEKLCVVSCDNDMFIYDIAKKRKVELADDLLGEKKSPYLHENEVYFSSNSESEYFKLYKVSIRGQRGSVVVHQTQYDLKMPKFDGQLLYYVECAQNEYLLKRKKINGDSIETITHRGVVYQYEFYSPHTLVIVYSDLETPRSLVIYDTEKRQLKNISGSSIRPDYAIKYLQPQNLLSAAYVISPKNENRLKGVILFFHPGLRSDFSPRWDTILLALVSNCYVLLAPNYPMSSGYGKSYNNLSPAAAVVDMLKWKDTIKKQYPNIPVYFMSASSGNILMEECLQQETKGINGAISLFGLFQRVGYKPIIPSLYILGKNDPLVDYQIRKTILLQQKNRNISLIIYPNEGHWIRRDKNIKNSLERIHSFLQMTS